MSDSLTDLILSLTPEDGSSIGNGAMMALLHEHLPGLADEDYAAARDELVEDGTLGRGRGRGGSIYRADVADLELTEPEMKEARPSTTARKKAARKSDDPTQVVSYRHGETRVNNPEVGMVHAGTDPDGDKTTWAYDPHLDPVLNFDSARGGIETLIDDALASDDPQRMKDALVELKRLQQPYLNWTGKAEKTSFEVDTVSLHVHERVDPATILANAAKRLKGKDAPSQWRQPDLFAAPFENLPLRQALDFYHHEKGWSNRLVAGDSLLVMNSLLTKESMGGKVQMIYIDPPYGIKYGSNFQPFTNKRDVKDRLDDDLTQEPEMIKAFRDTWELGIHSYLSYLRDRLILSRELLSDSGSIFVQISDENLHYIRSMMEEVFGVEQFVSIVPFRKKLMPLGAKTLEQMSDFLIWFCKDQSKIKYRHIYRETMPDAKGRWTGTVGETGGLNRLTKEEREMLRSGIAPEKIFGTISQWAPSFSPEAVFDFEFEGFTYKPAGGQCWVTSYDKMNRLRLANRLFVEKDSPRFVSPHSDYPYAKITSPWHDTAPASGKTYVVQTNENVIERCMVMTTDPGDLVLDPTCGSGTSAVVAEKLGRR
jgi:adenine-specific DNA-methyltransferase